MALAPPRTVVTGPPRDPMRLWHLLRASVSITIALTLVQSAIDLFDLLAAPDLSAPTLAVRIWYYGSSYAPYAMWIVFFLSIFFLMWLTYRLARNLHLLAPRKFSMSPTYAIGWYVVPIANIFMPPRVTGLIARETFAAAGDARNHNVVIGWWWAAFLLTALLGNVAAIVAANSGAFDPEAAFDSSIYETSLLINLLAAATNVVACIFLLRVFEPLAQAQATLVRAWRDERSATAAS